MDFQQLRHELPAVIVSGISIEMIGPPGIGKSDFARSMRDVMSEQMSVEWGFVTCNLAAYTPPDLLGYLFKGEGEDTDWQGKHFKYTSTDPTTPMWMVTDAGHHVSHYKYGILHLDEFGQASPDVKAAAASIILEKRAGPHRLPSGWVVMASSNRQGDRSAVTKPLDFIINRRVEYQVKASFPAWKDWAVKKGISPVILAHAELNMETVFNSPLPDKAGTPWLTPRSLCMSEKYLTTKAKLSGKVELPTDSDSIETVTGMIGQAAAAQLFSTIKLQGQVPTMEEILASPRDAKIPSDPSVKMLAMHAVMHSAKLDNVDRFIQYVNRFPKEFNVSFVSGLVSKDAKFCASSALRRWANDNADLADMLTRFSRENQ